jgi:hypothetical protein
MGIFYLEQGLMETDRVGKLGAFRECGPLHGLPTVLVREARGAPHESLLMASD